MPQLRQHYLPLPCWLKSFTPYLGLLSSFVYHGMDETWRRAEIEIYAESSSSVSSSSIEEAWKQQQRAVASDTGMPCRRCRRPCSLWRNLYISTGWQGVCCPCNWVRRFGDVTRVIEFRILKKLPLLGGDVQGALCVFLAGEACYAQVLSGSARSELRQFEENAMRIIWCSILLGHEKNHWPERCMEQYAPATPMIKTRMVFLMQIWITSIHFGS